MSTHVYTDFELVVISPHECTTADSHSVKNSYIMLAKVSLSSSSPAQHTLSILLQPSLSLSEALRISH